MIPIQRKKTLALLQSTPSPSLPLNSRYSTFFSCNKINRKGIGREVLYNHFNVKKDLPILSPTPLLGFTRRWTDSLVIKWHMTWMLMNDDKEDPMNLPAPSSFAVYL